MSTDLIIVGLRALFVLFIYVFLAQVVLVIVRDLRQAPGREAVSGREGAYLVVVDGGGPELLPGQRFGLETVTSLGRAQSNTICLADNFASAEHALLAWRHGQWWLEDLGSTNGTTLNRRPVRAPARVKSGDIIEVGQTKMKMLQVGDYD